MKKTIASIALLIAGLITPSCSDIATKPEEPQEMHAQVSSHMPFVNAEPIKERPNKDTVKKDTTERKKDTTERKKDTVSKPRPTIFGDLLVSLNLTAEQKAIVDKLLVEHKSCVENCVKPLKEAEAEIFKKARIQEAEIKMLLQTGKITKAQARERLAALKARVNKALKEIPIRAKVQECIKSCDAAFINSLERILSERQKLILKTWVSSREKRGTGGKKDTTDVKPRG